MLAKERANPSSSAEAPPRSENDCSADSPGRAAPAPQGLLGAKLGHSPLQDDSDLLVLGFPAPSMGSFELFSHLQLRTLMLHMELREKRHLPPAPGVALLAPCRNGPQMWGCIRATWKAG